MEKSCIGRGRVRVERYLPLHDTVLKRYRVAFSRGVSTLKSTSSGRDTGDGAGNRLEIVSTSTAGRETSAAVFCMCQHGISGTYGEFV